jgi:hypothetical protein
MRGCAVFCPEQQRLEAFVKKLRVALLLGFAALGMAGSLSACVVEEGHGWRHEHRDWR